MKLHHSSTFVHLLNGASNGFISFPSARSTTSKLHSATAVNDKKSVATNTATSSATAAPDNSNKENNTDSPRMPPPPELNENALFQCNPSI